MTTTIKRYFRRSKRNPPSSSTNQSPVLIPQEEPNPNPASAAEDVDATRRAFDDITPISSTGQAAVKLVAQADTRVISAQSLSDTYLKPLKIFNTVVTGFVEAFFFLLPSSTVWPNVYFMVHPYVRMALSILTFAAHVHLTGRNQYHSLTYSSLQLIIAEANIDNALLALVEKLGYVYTFLLEKDTVKNMKSMKENLGRIVRVISDSAGFIKNYSKTTNFCALPTLLGYGFWSFITCPYLYKI
ncbi:hypothetical protein EV401DRAFT_2073378 [Pisolithus croceorrhizus]|nr:hypothetical protein EV401DRAFT_2073378 [Pisolithus croceorrhizus]